MSTQWQQGHAAAAGALPALCPAGREPPAGPALQGFCQCCHALPIATRRFSARLDPSTGLYLALTNPSIDRYGGNPDARSILALAFSRDLLSWRVAATLLRPNDGLPWEDSLWRTAYQYAGEAAAAALHLRRARARAHRPSGMHACRMGVRHVLGGLPRALATVLPAGQTTSSHNATTNPNPCPLPCGARLDRRWRRSAGGHTDRVRRRPLLP